MLCAPRDGSDRLSGGEGWQLSGGPKSEVPYHPGEKKTVGQKKVTSGGSHHYYGGPKSEVPHHMGPK